MDMDHPLFSAVKKGDLEMVRELINVADPYPAKEGLEEYDLVLVALQYNHGEIAKLLLLDGFKINGSIERRSTPLHYAAMYGDVEIVKMLLDRNARIDAKDKQGKTSLHRAIEENQIEVVKLFLNHKTRIDSGEDSITPTVRKLNPDDPHPAKECLEEYDLLQVAFQCDHREIAKLLLLNGFKVNGRKECHSTPLHYAAMYGDIEIVEMLLDRNARIDASDEHGKTSLDRAVEENEIEVVKLLTNHKACVDANRGDGITPMVSKSFNPNEPYSAIECRKGYNLLRAAVQYKLRDTAKRLLLGGSEVNGGKEFCATPLHYAAMYGDVEIVEMLLDRNARIDARDGSSRTALHCAVEENHIEVVKVLLKHNADVNTKRGYTPLHVAAVNDRTEVARLLLMKGADVNAIAEDSWSPLHLATINGHVTTVKLLLEQGANIDAHAGGDMTVLYIAITKARADIVKEILNFGPDVNNESNRTSFYWAIENNLHVFKTIVTDLLEYGFTVSSKDIYNYRILRSAVRSGYLKIVEYFVHCGVDVNMSEGSCTLLHTAAMGMQMEVALYLINCGANVNATDVNKRTPIFYALESGDLRMTELLLTNGADIEKGSDLLNDAVTKGFIKIVEYLLQHNSNIDVNRKDKRGRTPLYCTVLTPEGEPYKADIAKLLLSKGAKVNFLPKNEDPILYAALNNGFVKLAEVLLQYNVRVNIVLHRWLTPLHVSVQRGYERITQMLLNRGAMVNAKRNKGTTALHLATNHRHVNIVKMLLEHGAEVNCRVRGDISGGTTPLHFAVRRGYIDIVKILIEYGADIDALDEYGNTALHEACLVKNKSAIQLLLQSGSDINILNKDYLTAIDFCFGISILDPNLEGDTIVSEFSCIDKIFMRHIAKLKTNNLYVHKKCLQRISARPNLKQCYVECEREIYEMKKEKICGTNVSFYDVLTKGVHQLAIYTRHKTIVEVFESGEYVKMFPMYAELLECQFTKGQQRQCLLNSSIPSFNSLLGYELSHLITNNILSYLSNVDLGKLNKCLWL